jgi:DNA-binding MarR family transcriptional regulator
MKQLGKPHKILSRADGAQAAADWIMDAMQLVMGAVRRKMRRPRRAHFSMPRFRILAFLHRHEGATLSDVATHAGLMRPTMSKAVDALVRDGWVSRQVDPRDRRRVRLALTGKGRERIDAKRRQVNAVLAERLAMLGARERGMIVRAMRVLHAAFGDASGDGRGAKRHNSPPASVEESGSGR